MHTHIFNDLEGIRIAIEMERRGRDFYGAVAKMAQNAPLEVLRAEENAHMNQFRRLYDLEQELLSGDEAYSAETSAYLTAVAADIVFSDGLVSVGVRGGFSEPQVILAESIRSEQQSIDFYRALSETTRDAHAACVFREIIAQEQMHLERLRGQLSRYQ